MKSFTAFLSENKLKPLRDWLKLILKTPLPKLVLKEIEDELDVEYREYDADRMPGIALRAFRESCDRLAEPILKKIISDKEKSENKKKNKLVIHSKNEAAKYTWMTTWSGKKTIMARNGKYVPILEMIADSIFEYHVYSDKSISDISFTFMTEEEASKFLGTIVGKSLVIGVNKNFFTKHA